MRISAMLGAVGLCLCAAGCKWLSWPAYVFAPSPPQRTVKPQFDALVGRSVAVVVFAGPQTQLDYQLAQLEVSDAVSIELRRRVKDVTTVSPRAVLRYQAENPSWEALPPHKLCRALNCDYVLLISLREFSTRELGSIYLARGRITAEAALYPAQAPGSGSGRAVWRSGTIRVLYPPDSPLGLPASDDRAIRAETVRILAQRLVRNFYKHKVPREP